MQHQTDSRFAALKNDPRFSRHTKKKAKLIPDKRFAVMHKSKDFEKKTRTKTDRYGRPNQDVASSSESSDDSSSESNDEPTKFSPEDRMDKLNRLARGDGPASELSEENTSDSDEDECQRPNVSSVDDDSDDYSTGDEYNENLGVVERIPTGEETRRIALVNMDWSRVTAVDIYALLLSFLCSGGVILKVTVYPSQFGSERLALEATQGPVGIYRTSTSKNRKTSSIGSSSLSDSDSEDEDNVPDINHTDQSDTSTGLDPEKVRQYEKDRLRYYFAIVVCDSVKTAASLYDECDGMEYETSSNVLDLRFVPDDTTFEAEPRDSATSVPEKYNPPSSFVTAALQQSNVTLTWDGSDEERDRTLVQWRQASDTKQKQLNKDEDLRNYLAGSSSDEDKEEHLDSTKKQKSMRSLLGLGSASEDSDSDDGDVLEVTFTPGLAENIIKQKKETAIHSNETVFERYQREKRKKKKLRQRSKLVREQEKQRAADQLVEDEDGMDKGSFLRDTTTIKERNKNSIVNDKRKLEELKLLATPGFSGVQNNGLEDYDYNEIIKEEKRSGKRRRVKKKNQKESVVDTFSVDTEDPRFAAIYSEPSFAIDPTDSKFKKTKAMKQILSMKNKKRVEK
jgi:hypothetical protein|eukprot:Stramenopile-MAST_4_protein_2899